MNHDWEDGLFEHESREPTGTTGTDLLSKLREYLDFGCDYDYLLLVDDEDCRFHGKNLQQLHEWKETLQKEVRDKAGKDVELFVLLASPEIEAWFVVDWERGLGGHYSKIQFALNKEIRDSLENFYDNPEGYGGGFNGQACINKLSDRLEELVKLHGVNGEKFSKKIDSVEMLKEIDPDRVAARCTRFFAPVYQQLCEIR